jgi:hypothetical protein
MHEQVSTDGCGYWVGRTLMRQLGLPISAAEDSSPFHR